MTRVLNVIGAGGFARQVLPAFGQAGFDDVRFVDDDKAGARLGNLSVVPFTHIRAGEHFVVAVSDGLTRRCLVKNAWRRTFAPPR